MPVVARAPCQGNAWAPTALSFFLCVSVACAQDIIRSLLWTQGLLLGDLRDSRLLLGTWNAGMVFCLPPFHPFHPGELQAILSKPCLYAQLDHDSIPPLGETIAWEGEVGRTVAGVGSGFYDSGIPALMFPGRPSHSYLHSSLFITLPPPQASLGWLSKP